MKLTKLSKLVLAAAVATIGMVAQADTKARTYKLFTQDGKPSLSEMRIEDEGGVVTIRILAQNPNPCLPACAAKSMPPVLAKGVATKS